MKAIYMVDVPKIGDCDSCPLYDIEDVMNGTKMVCLADKEEGENCPLRPLPQMAEVSDDAYVSDYLDFDLGWNACLKEITGNCDEE